MFLQRCDYVDASVQACYINGKRYGVPIAVEQLRCSIIPIGRFSALNLG